VWSELLTPQVISQRVGLGADFERTRGADRDGPPPLPRTNTWNLGEPKASGEPLDDQLQRLHERLKPLEAALAQIAREPGTELWLHIVRNFVDEPTVEELGVSLDPDLIGFLARVGAGLDIDEYPFDSQLDVTTEM
jgi:hypothetical protein